MRYRTDADAVVEAEIAGRLAVAWNCEIHAFPPLTPIDYYAARADAVVGYLELKGRTCTSDAFDTVYLAVRKWLALQLVAVAQGLPARFVVRWADDQIRWISIADVDARAVTIAGTLGNGHGRDGIEPVILVPVDGMRPL